jgi:hypothetical protein
MLTTMWISAISAVIAVLIAIFSIYTFWQSNQLLMEKLRGKESYEEIHEINTAPTEILNRLNLAASEPISTATDLALPSSSLLVVDRGAASIASDNFQQVDLSKGTLPDAPTTRHGVYVVIDGKIIPIEVPLAIQSRNTEVVYVKLLPPPSDSSGDEDFHLESADYPSATATASISPTQGIDIDDTGIVVGQAQNFSISFETTEGTKRITIVVW